MTRGAARFLTRLYPPAWRVRYGEEFQAFLESRRVPFRETLNIIASALSERLAIALPIVACACLAIIAAGGGLYLAASGARPTQAFKAHPVLWMCWAMIEASSLLLVALGGVAVAPALFRSLRKPTRSMLWKLARPVGAGLLVLLWLWLVWMADSAEKAGSVGMFMAFGLGTFLEAVAGFLKYIIAHSQLSQFWGRGRLAVLAMSASIIVVTITAAGWGLLSKSFGARGFPLGPYVCWAVAVTALAGTAISGALTARRLFFRQME